MPRATTSKTILHAVATEGKTVHRWVVACFPSRAEAGVFAGMLKMAHASGVEAQIKQLDPATPKGADGKLLKLDKLSAQEIPYSPHKIPGFGLDDEPETAPASAPEPSK
jgi:hypothetical protein